MDFKVWLETEETLADYFDFNFEIDEAGLLRLATNSGIRLEKIDFPAKYVYVEFGGHGPAYVYERDSNGRFSRSEADDWLESVSNRTHEFYGEYSDEVFNKQFWQNPPPLYHGTSDMQGVLNRGLLVMNKTRGISNRLMGSAVFTSTNPDGIDSYATDGIVIIDTAAMKRDGFTPWVTMEEPLENNEQLCGIAHAIGMEDYYCDYESGISEETVVVHDNIPAKYVKEYQ
jgi:hypothetical protein